SFQPSASDILKISTCDVFIYVGGESDEWVEDALQEATNPDMVVINLLDALGDSVKEEEVVEGMQEDHDHDHDHEDGEDHDEDHDADEDHDHDHDHEEETEYDEHVWLSLRNAAVLTERICDAVCTADPANAESYRANCGSYVGKLSDLDARYADAVAGGSVSTVLFGDRFPFRYLMDDYGLSYYAAFVGCSAETEASFETVTFLAGKVDELKLPAVLTIEGKEHRIAETIVQTTASKDQKILTMDSMQATTAGDVENGVTYLSVMEQNLSVLKDALN
ncbi:MAG: zinc ABC transporter substrate-binding protein, partial [Lachnospiraceae bacterium]|nr:zinc ABC transporter substrate-binding protein [Lachnospiraceae bacterium]